MAKSAPLMLVIDLTPVILFRDDMEEKCGQESSVGTCTNFVEDGIFMGNCDVDGGGRYVCLEMEEFVFPVPVLQCWLCSVACLTKSWSRANSSMRTA